MKRSLSALRVLLATAPALGLGLVSARATVFGPLQLPGHGTVVAGSAGVSGVSPIIHGTQTISTGAGKTAINWGATGGTINTSQPGGFNIGQSAILHFSGGLFPNLSRTVLNVDTSGTPSQIFGMLTGAGNYSIFVANANGITVGPNATITAPAGLGLIAAKVDTAKFLSTSFIPVSFMSSGPLTVQGNLQGVGGFVLLAGSGAVNVSPIQSATGTTFATNNVTVVGGVGGAVLPFFGALYANGGLAGYNDGPGSATPSATSPTTVTLNLGTSAFMYNMTGLTVLANGNIVNNRVLGGVPNALGTGNNIVGQPTLQWTGTLTNNGTILAELDSNTGFPATSGKVNFQGNTSAMLAYGGLVNNGTIASNSGSGNALFVQLPGTIINNSGATISNVGGSVYLEAGGANNVSGYLPLFTGVGGAVINYGTITAYHSIGLFASNPNHVGPNPGGGVYTNGTLQFLSSSAHTQSNLYLESFTGNAFLGGTVSTPNDALGLATASFQSGAQPVSTFTLGTNVTAQNQVTFSGGSLTGPGTVTTNNLLLVSFVGNVNNVTSPTHYLANGFHVANGTSGSTNVLIELPTNGDGAIGRQVVNLNVAGNATLTSGGTSTFTNSLGPVTLLPTQANVGSSLLVQASGNLTVNPSSTGPFNASLASAALATPGFVFPGGVVLIAGNTLTLNTVVDNGYAQTVGAGQGIFFQAPTIVTGAPVITSGNAWANFSTAPTIVPAIYAATPAVTISPLAYTIVANPSAYHIRSYAP